MDTYPPVFLWSKPFRKNAMLYVKYFEKKKFKSLCHCYTINKAPACPSTNKYVLLTFEFKTDILLLSVLAAPQYLQNLTT